jgi:hypothetical protein
MSAAQVADLLSRLHSAGITLDVFICSYGKRPWHAADQPPLS